MNNALRKLWRRIGAGAVQWSNLTFDRDVGVFTSQFLKNTMVFFLKKNKILTYSEFQVWVSSESRASSFRHLSDPLAVRQGGKILFWPPRKVYEKWINAIFPILKSLLPLVLIIPLPRSMASSENGDGSENVGSPGGLLPVAVCLPYYPYPLIAAAASFAHIQMRKDGYRGNSQIHGDCHSQAHARDISCWITVTYCRTNAW